MNFSRIETERLVLNRPSENDLAQIVKILNNPIYAQNTLNIPFPYSIEDAKFWLKLSQDGFENQSQFIFTICERNSGETIGGIGLTLHKQFNKAELGYWLNKDYWNKGLTTEAVKAIIKFGFNSLKLKRIFASHFEFNTSSGKVMENAGMKKEGTLICHTKKNNEYQNHVIYAIINKTI